MKIRKWMIGIFALLCIELLLFLVITTLFSEKTAAGGNRGSIRQSTVDPQYSGRNLEYQTEGEGKLEQDGENRGEGSGDNGTAGKDGETEGEGSGGNGTAGKDGETVGEGSGGNGTAGKSGKTKDTVKQQDGSVFAHRAASKNSEGEREREIYRKNKKTLVLVNGEHAILNSYDPCLRTICSGRLQASEKIYPALTQMLADAEEQGYHYWIASAYRSRERQQRLVEEDVRRAMQKGMSYLQAWRETCKETMPAGHSEHQTGLALDILCSGNMKMDVSQKKEPGNRWLRENCSRYGFILRYPEEKSEITGISFEPWHFRYVGKQAAKYMQEQDITLEEFWERME